MEMDTSKQETNEIKLTLADLSLWGVIASNILSIAMALIFGWDMGQIMWVYWGQSVIIGALNVKRMLGLKDFTTKGMTMNNAPVPETQAAKAQVAVFFTFHYGFFHFIYAIFLWQELALDSLTQQELMLLGFCIIGFFAAHRFSLGYNASSDFKQKKPNLGTLMFYPYLRIIPMHLTIIAGANMDDAAWVMIMFMSMKTLADAGMHMIEHHLFRKPGKDFDGRMKD